MESVAVETSPRPGLPRRIVSAAALALLAAFMVIAGAACAGAGCWAVYEGWLRGVLLAAFGLWLLRAAWRWAVLGVDVLAGRETLSGLAAAAALIFGVSAWAAAAKFLPFYLAMHRKGEHGAALGGLGAARAALELHKVERGTYPKGLQELTAGGYLETLPPLWDGRWAGFHHPRSAQAADASSRTPVDSGRWTYVSEPKTEAFGTLFIDCTHTDYRGSAWASY